MAELAPRERFLKIYANLPIAIREEIIVALPSHDPTDKDWRPITWNVAYIEVKNNTDLGKKILEYLVTLKII